MYFNQCLLLVVWIGLDHQVCKMATGNNEMVSTLRQTLDKASLEEVAKLSHWEVLKIILKKMLAFYLNIKV